MKIATINDTHFGSRNDSLVFDDNFEKFYTELFFPYLREHNINTVIHLGDAFDRRKYVNFLTLENIKRYFFSKFSEYEIRLHMIVGNHDTFYKNTNDINSPNLLLKDYYPWIQVYDKAELLNFDGTHFFFVPWINDANIADTLDHLKYTRSDIVFGHLELSGFEMYRGDVIHIGIDRKIFSKFDIVASGHFHHKSIQDNIHYLGAPYQMTWNDYDDDRGFHIFDTETREFEYIKNPYVMFHKVFYNDNNTTIEELMKQDFSKYKNTFVKFIIEKKNNPYWLDLVFDKLDNVGCLDLKVIDSSLQLDNEEISVNQAEDTLASLKKYVNQLGIKEDDTKKLELLFGELYHEALSLE